MRQPAIIFFLICLAFSCVPSEEEPSDKRFRLLKSTGIDFQNTLDYTEDVNPYTFKNFYNGGGVGVGDINNDGFPDVFFCGNMVSNRLYLNKATSSEVGIAFEDITESAGLLSENVWSTGVTFVDINYDGWMDIYVCKSGPPGGPNRRNSLYINNGDLTFREEAEKYGLDNLGLSTHASFFDYDRDGDLDCYLLNNSIRSVGGYDLIKDQREIPDSLGGNMLLRNDDNRFVDVSAQAGIYSSSIGFGLGVTISDIDMDGWLDIYVSNDFFERDYLYINQQNGTFAESLTSYMTEISMGSMGADIADLNNDGYNEVFVTEMLPERHDRVMSKASFEGWDKYQLQVQQGYYHQFGRNALQLNNRNGTFSEVSRLAGVEATDWSWGALIFDMNNDGHSDLFVANGIYKDLLDQDYINFMANPDAIRKMLQDDGNAIKKLIDMIPSEPLANYAYENQGNLEFKNAASDWGLDQLTFSNGSAYADLDNDGDLDLLLNNVNMPAFVYENHTNGRRNNFISIKLQGKGRNPNAIGSKVWVYGGGRGWSRELTPMRGFQSSVDQRLHFGLGTLDRIDSVVIQWPDGRESRKLDVDVNRLVEISYAGLDDTGLQGLNERNGIFQAVDPSVVPYLHTENTYVDFDRDRLLFDMASNEGPCACKGDVNGDGLEDVYLGGARGQTGRIYLQQRNGTFIEGQRFDAEAGSEDTDCTFSDFDRDGDIDLIVASGGSEFTGLSLELRDRIYTNIGGKFRLMPEALPGTELRSTGTVAVSDFDGDGYPDLFLGDRLRPQYFGLPVSGHLFQNKGDGTFHEVTEEIAPLKEIGMITAAQWADIDGDGDEDLLLAGEWMPLKVFINQDGSFTESLEAGFSNSSGMYHTLQVADVDGDGDVDVLAGNNGTNSRFRATIDAPMRIYVGDFDRNGSIEHITAYYRDGAYFPMIQLKDLIKQLPGMKKKFLRYEAYKEANMTDVFTPEQLEGAVTYEIVDLETSLYLNDGSGIFTKAALPREAQFSPVYAISAGDYNGDGKMDFVLGGNQHMAKPETGIYAGSYGQLFLGAGNGDFRYTYPNESGISTTGDVRSILEVNANDRPLLLFLKNNDQPYIVTY